MEQLDLSAMRGFEGADIPPASIYNQCIRCGLCLPTCPTYLETMTETSGPRGRISLIKAVGEGRLDVLSPGFVAQMTECLDCRACEAVCPSGVRYGALVETARTQIARRQAPDRSRVERFARWLLLHRLFASRRWMRVLAIALRFAERSGLLRLAALVGMRAQAELAPPIPNRFFEPRPERIETPRACGTAFLHLGCIMPVAFPDVHAASVRMLERARMSVVIPPDQGCCGAIAVHAGDMSFGRELAKRNIVAFERSGADVYVVNAAGCGSTLKEYGELFADDDEWRTRAQRFAQRVRDITEVLDAMELDPHMGPLRLRVTYQDACHLVHAQRVSAAPRRLLQRIPELTLVEMPESSVCCGSAGIYNLTQPAMARRLQTRKLANLGTVVVDVVATANPGCAMQLASGLRAAHSPVRVKHVVELLDDAYAAYTGAVRSPSLSAAARV